MTIAYWVAVAGLATTITLARLNIRHEDTWGDKLLPWTRLALAATIGATIVFVAWFGMDSLGVHISMGD